MGAEVCKAKGTFLPRAHILPSSLGPRIPCSSGAGLDSQAFYLPSAFLDPRSVQRQGISGGTGYVWRVDLQAHLSTPEYVS